MTAREARGVSQSVKALSLCVLVLAVAALAAAVEPARACSCIQPDPWRVLEQADGAFVGRLVSRLESGDGRAVLVFRVERAVKGKIEATVEVATANNGAACGIETSVGRRIGLFLVREGGRWFGHLCWQVAPEDLLAAAALPAPNGTGPVALYVGGRFGPARMLALDAKGRTLAYGLGKGAAGRPSLCPGGQRLVEVSRVSSRIYAGIYPSDELAIRDARTLRVIRRQPLKLPGRRYEEGLLCEDRLGSRLLIFAGHLGDAPNDKAIVRLAGGRLTVIWEGDAFAAALSSAVVYLSAGMSGENLLAVDPRTGRWTRLTRLPEAVQPLRLNAAGTHLAGVDFRPDTRSQIVLVDLRQRPAQVRTALLGGSGAYGDLVWLPSGRFLFLPWEGRDAARVFDVALSRHSQFRWLGEDGALVGSTVFGIDYRRGRLVSAKLPTGPQRIVRRLPGKPQAIVSATG